MHIQPLQVAQQVPAQSSCWRTEHGQHNYMVGIIILL